MLRHRKAAFTYITKLSAEYKNAAVDGRYFQITYRNEPPFSYHRKIEPDCVLWLFRRERRKEFSESGHGQNICSRQELKFYYHRGCREATEWRIR